MEYIKLKDICDLKNGYAFKSSDYIEKSDVLNCRMSNIRPNATFDAEYNPKYLPNDYAEKYKEYLLDDGDLIIAMTDLANDPKILGVPTIVDTKGYKMLLNQRVGKLLLLNERPIKKKYLKYALSVPQNRGYFKKFAGGGVQINIGKAEILNIDIPYCDIETQNKIVEVLDKAQSLIEKKKEQIELLDELVKSRFIEMFGDPISNSKGWEKQEINEVAPVSNYKGEFDEEKIWLLNLDMVESNSGRIIDFNYVDKEEIGSSTCTFDTDNVLYSKLRPYLNKVVIPDRIGYATSEMIPLKPNKKVLNREYLTYSLRNKSFVDYISEKVSGAKMPRVVMNDFKSFELPVPPIELQNEFAEFVTKIDEIKSKMETSLSELEDNFNSLMQKAFKGELF